jgi:hypothetical protein
MRTWAVACVTTFAVVTGVENVAAQGTYVGASVFGDIVRTSHTDDFPGGEGDGGQAFGFTLRVGAPIGATWGIEAEFARPGEIDHEPGSEVIPLRDSAVRFAPGGFTWSSIGDVSSTSPLLAAFAARSSERHTTFSTSLWYQQQLTSRVSLVYLAGAGFHRTTRELAITFVPRIPIPIVLPPFESETTIYGVRPMVGLESRIAMTDRVQLVPGLRLHAGDNTWLVRPSVGLNWIF